jgi:formylglycine-generating enzyme required for sulfatase activity
MFLMNSDELISLVEFWANFNRDPKRIKTFDNILNFIRIKQSLEVAGIFQKAHSEELLISRKNLSNITMDNRWNIKYMIKSYPRKNNSFSSDLIILAETIREILGENTAKNKLSFLFQNALSNLTKHWGITSLEWVNELKKIYLKELNKLQIRENVLSVPSPKTLLSPLTWKWRLRKYLPRIRLSHLKIAGLFLISVLAFSLLILFLSTKKGDSAKSPPGLDPKTKNQPIVLVETPNPTTPPKSPEKPVNEKMIIPKSQMPTSVSISPTQTTIPPSPYPTTIIPTTASPKLVPPTSPPPQPHQTSSERSLPPPTLLPPTPTFSTTIHPTSPPPTPESPLISPTEIPISPLTAYWDPTPDKRQRLIIVSRPPLTEQIELVEIEPGTFNRGSNDYPDERPIHQITISQKIYMAKTETTQSQMKCILNIQLPFWSQDMNETQNLPASGIDWTTAKRFCETLKQALGDSVSEIRMPYEYEWEYVAKQDPKVLAELQTYAWLGENPLDAQVHPVAQKSADRLGIYDLFGNVEEWMEDFYDENAYLSSESYRPKTGLYRVVRGGACYLSLTEVTPSRRWKAPPDQKNKFRGFRIVVISSVK